MSDVRSWRVQFWCSNERSDGSSFGGAHSRPMGSIRGSPEHGALGFQPERSMGAKPSGNGKGTRPSRRVRDDSSAIFSCRRGSAENVIGRSELRSVSPAVTHFAILRRPRLLTRSRWHLLSLKGRAVSRSETERVERGRSLLPRSKRHPFSSTSVRPATPSAHANTIGESRRTKPR